MSIRSPCTSRPRCGRACSDRSSSTPNGIPGSRSTRRPVRLAGDGRVELDGELTIRGVTRPVTAAGQYAPPRPSNFGEIAGLQLHTSFDRREFGFDWQMALPGGGDAVGWDVEVDIDLLLKRDDPDTEA